jgi:hypothetical protein
LTTGHLPKIWDKGYIVPIFKSGSRDDPSNYRGITIGSCLCKLLVKILNNRLEKNLLSRNIIKPEQIGFCKGKRTSDHHFVLKTLIEKYNVYSRGGKQFFTCFVDLQKAFDTVNHEGLLYILRKIGISDSFYNNTSLTTCVQLVHYFVHMYSCITWIPFLYILAYNLYCMFSFFSDFFGCILPPITLNGDSCNKNIDIKFSVHVHNTFLE